ncbi:MAG: hypothetical protein EXQ63_03945 [Ilumatobacteraceae bacterium]|nr:hypothetical protein [Ilumatobacteraceae bacterium]
MLSTTRTAAIIFPNWDNMPGHDDSDTAHRAFESVVRALSGIAPLIEVDTAGVALLATRGPSRYFGGDVAVGNLLYGLCAEQAFPVSHGVGIADGRVAALAAAYQSCFADSPCIVSVGMSEDFLGLLPTDALGGCADIDADTVDLLRRLGLTTIGAVAGLTERELIDRFGLLGERLHHIVHGFDISMLVPDVVPIDDVVQHVFEDPVLVSGVVVAAMNEPSHDLVTALERRAVQCIRLHMLFETDHGERSERMWHQPRGFSERAILERIRWQLDGWLGADADTAATAGIVRVQLSPMDVRPVDTQQQSLWGGRQEHVERVMRSIALAISVHADIDITVPEWQGGRDVAHVFLQVPVGSVDIRDHVACAERVSTGRGAEQHWTGSVPTPWPAIVFSQPQVVQLQDKDGSIVVITGRHELLQAPSVLCVQGSLLDHNAPLADVVNYAVQQFAGPWPVEERWWDPVRRRRLARLQLLVQHPHTQAEYLVLLTIENRQWYVSAVYD